MPVTGLTESFTGQLRSVDSGITDSLLSKYDIIESVNTIRLYDSTSEFTLNEINDRVVWRVVLKNISLVRDDSIGIYNPMESGKTEVLIDSISGRLLRVWAYADSTSKCNINDFCYKFAMSLMYLEKYYGLPKEIPKLSLADALEQSLIHI